MLLLTVALIAQGCGGSKAAANVASGTGFRFTAPAGWAVTGHGSQVGASRGGSLVRVTLYPLVKPYTAALFSRVTRDEEARVAAVAASENGRIIGRGVARPAGIPSHTWRIASGSNVDEYTFVLTGRREYELLCRRPAAGSDAACVQLVSSFSLG